MGARKKDVIKLSLACANCGTRNYTTVKSKQSTERLELKKYCQRCDAHTPHKETR